jgi:ubiquinol-cytochrome c reductase iron-sulfur subunit
MADHAQAAPGAGGTRRDFLYLMSASAAAFGAASVVWPFISSMNPSGDVLALSSIEVDISGVQLGQAITVKWRGKPVFIRHRTPEEIEAAKKADPEVDPANPKVILSNPSGLRDPQTDASRVQKPEWLILVGVCTHLGCVPLGQKPSDPRGEFGGWYCPCHGSQYDTSGRIRKGPAPLDLEVPVYSFETDTNVKIG